MLRSSVADRGRRLFGPLARGLTGGALGVGFRRHLFAEGGDLEGLLPELDVRQPEPPSDDPAVPEQPFDLLRMRGGPEIEILRAPVQQQVTDTAANEVGLEVVLLEPVDDLECVVVDVPAGERVFRSRDGCRRRHSVEDYTTPSDPRPVCDGSWDGIDEP